MSPTRTREVRERILADHQRVRCMLDRVEVLAHKVLQGRRGVVVELCEQMGVLDEQLREHMVLEERILVPLLRDADPLGPQREARFHEEHSRQRRIMDQVVRERTDDESAMLAFALVAWGFVRLIRDDMAEEEKISLNPRVLRDER